MNDKTLKVLEYHKIVKKLIDKTESQLGKDMTKKIKPSTNIDEIEYLQRETEEALSLIIKKGNPPLYGICDVSGELKKAEIGGRLSQKLT